MTRQQLEELITDEELRYIDAIRKKKTYKRDKDTKKKYHKICKKSKKEIIKLLNMIADGKYQGER